MCRDDAAFSLACERFWTLTYRVQDSCRTVEQSLENLKASDFWKLHRFRTTSRDRDKLLKYEQELYCKSSDAMRTANNEGVEYE